MIYTVTFNPSLDYILRLDHFAAGEINRVNYEQILGGGKGINVSIVLKNLGHDSTALGFVAGFTGEEIKRQLQEFGVNSDFVQLEQGFSRINVKVKADKETEINGQGPDISENKQVELFQNWINWWQGIPWYWRVQFQRHCRMIFISVLWHDLKARGFESWLMRKRSCF